jgi:hypothetical protein
LETKPLSIIAERYREFLIKKVLPAIKTRWPDWEQDITIQQDEASPHFKQNDPAFLLATATARNWEIKLLTQPAQSPDTNLLNLSFFWALQLLQWNHWFVNEINGLIVQVTRAYHDFSP